MKRTTTFSAIVGQFFDTMIVAASDNEWLKQPIKILVLETVLSHLKMFLSLDSRITRFDCFVDYQYIWNILMSDRIKISYTEF